MALAAGDLLLGLTDGLVERREQDLDHGLTSLLDVVGTEYDEPLDALVERVSQTLPAPVRKRDDATVLAVRFT